MMDHVNWTDLVRALLEDRQFRVIAAEYWILTRMSPGWYRSEALQGGWVVGHSRAEDPPKGF